MATESGIGYQIIPGTKVTTRPLVFPEVNKEQDI
jgi:hypothetical protein